MGRFPLRKHKDVQLPLESKGKSQLVLLGSIKFFKLSFKIFSHTDVYLKAIKLFQIILMPIIQSFYIRKVVLQLYQILWKIYQSCQCRVRFIYNVYIFFNQALIFIHTMHEMGSDSSILYLLSAPVKNITQMLKFISPFHYIGYITGRLNINDLRLHGDPNPIIINSD